MGLLSLKRDIQDLARLRKIITIVVEHGFHDFVAKAHLSHHAKISSRIIAAHEETTPQRVRETIEELGPTFVKLGQVLSLRPDLIPHAYCEEFRKLQDDVAPLSYPIIKGIIESELKRPLAKTFRDLSHAPLAAASISQVHAATLLDGTPVVVKVQRPGIPAVMAHDIDIMAYLADRLDRHHPQLRARQIVEEFARYTERELDFTFEAHNAKRFSAFFERDENVKIPLVFPEHSTQKMLVMERLVGVRVSDKGALAKAHVDEKALAQIGFETMFRQVFELGMFHADPHPGNLFAVPRKRRHALGMLDFGIVGFIDKGLQDRFIDLLSALLREDAHGVARILASLGDRGAHFNERAFEEEIAGFLAQWHGATFKEARMSDMLYRIISSGAAHDLRLPANIILLAKAFVTIEGAGVWLDPDFNITTQAEPLLKKLVAKRYSPAAIKAELVESGQEFHAFARDLPAAAETFIEKVREGGVQVQFDKSELLRAEQTYDFETSRKSLSLISSAFFIGSALIAGLAPELVFLSWPLYAWGFAGFLLTLFFLMRVSSKTHKYLERSD